MSSLKLDSDGMEHREFPVGASELPEGFDRREFLKLMAASLAMAGATACTRQPMEQIIPYVRQPEEIVPGRPLYFATALTLGGFARGVLVETHEGRPTKIEGNPEHPASLGATDIFLQAELLTLYDPDRSRSVVHNGQIASFEELLGELASEAGNWIGTAGSGLRLLTRHETSPTLLNQIGRLLAKYPGARWHEYEPIASSGVLSHSTTYHFDKAEVILSLDADFLASGPASLLYSRQFAAKRRSPQMNRLYVVEPTPTLTGAMADHRILMHPERITAFAQELESGTGKPASVILADLRRASGKSLVLAGDSQPRPVHDLAHRLNADLGNLGVTVEYGTGQNTPTSRNLRELVDEMKSGRVETLVILGGNPAYDGPVDFEFAQILRKIGRTIHVGQYRDETGVLCRWHVPEAHSLESWGDACAFDGTATILQPMIAPIYGGISRHEMLNALLQEPPTSSYETVRNYWRGTHAGDDFEQFWRNSLHQGVVANTGHTPSTEMSAPFSEAPTGAIGAAGGYHLLIRPSMQVYDGRYSNNAWLQEFPDPLTKIVWDNPALISPATAGQLQLDNGALINLKFRGRSMIAPVWILPGQAEGCVTVTLGYGRTQAGSVGNGVGFNAYQLRTSDALWGGGGLEIEKVTSVPSDESGSGNPSEPQLVTTQHHWRMEGRGQVRVGTLDQYRRTPHAIAAMDEPAPARGETLYPNYQNDSPAWGMVIDLNTCIGCGACTIACQAENNIPVVGKAQVAVHREMHWIRVDRYYEGDLSNPIALHQPVPCMHCENAPCELVCPVAATVHSGDGLNQMVYNRCIGTRYCSNNCPYKVRRFNFLEYDANSFEKPETRKLMRNPNVTVRSRGVMEKCTYCIQRINSVRIEARKANRPIRDGEIIPACAQACPADAIIFGDIADKGSRVAKMRALPLNYGLLAELNTRPRTTYQAKLRNPNPELETQ